MLRLCLLELDILFFAHAAAFCIMEWLYPGWWKKQKSKSTLQKKTQTIAPGMIIRFSETASGHTYKVHWIQTVAPFQEAETLTILSNADGYVLFRRSADNGVYVMDCVTAEQIAVVETEREVA